MGSSGVNTVDLKDIIGDPHTVASHIISLWYNWSQAKDLAESRWNETKKYVFATSTRETTNVNLPWSNTTHRPKIYQIFNNILVNSEVSLFPNRDWLEFIALDTQSNSKQKREAALAYLNSKHRLSGFKKVMRKLISDWVLTGNAFAGVEYVTEFTVDPITNERVPAYVGPRPYRIDPRNIVFNPLGNSFAEVPKIIRSKKTLGELQNELVENPAIQYDPEVIKRVLSDRSTVAKSRIEDKLTVSQSFEFDGYGSISEYYDSGFVTIHELYGDLYDPHTQELKKNQLVTIIDGRYVLRQIDLNTFSGKPLLFKVGWKERPDNLWSFGPLDNLVGLQYRINHLENAKADGFDKMLDPDIVITGDVEIRKVGAATYYMVPEGGNVRSLAPDTTILNAQFEISQIERDMEQYPGAPSEAVGIRSPGEKTAFEVSTLTGRADRVFEHQVNIFNDFLEEIITAELELSRMFLTGSDIVSIIDKDLGIETFISITRQDLISNGKVIPVGARESARKARLAQQLQGFFSTGLQDPEVLEHFPSKKLGEMWAELLDFEKLYEPHGRIPERLESQRRTAAAQDMLANELQVDPTGLSEEDQLEQTDQ